MRPPFARPWQHLNRRCVETYEGASEAIGIVRIEYRTQWEAHTWEAPEVLAGSRMALSRIRPSEPSAVLS